MLVSDLIAVELIDNGVTDVFGYQGGMIAHLFDSINNTQGISIHSTASEQGATFAACGYAQSTGKVGVVISTSGPGFTNMVTGIANAWFDSIPIIAISGQVNTKDVKGNLPIRQKGFQEMDAPSVVSSITKQTYEVDSVDFAIWAIKDAFKKVNEGRKGPVFIEIPINILESEVVFNGNGFYTEKQAEDVLPDALDILNRIRNANRPVLLLGAGIKQSGCMCETRSLVESLHIPVVTSMVALDILPDDHLYNFGWLGSKGSELAKEVVYNSDFVLAIGCRFSVRTVGYDYLESFAPNAVLARVDIDASEFSRKIKDGEINILCDAKRFINSLSFYVNNNPKASVSNDSREKVIKPFPRRASFGGEYVSYISSLLPNDALITCDVGVNLITCMKNIIVKEETRIFCSGGLGSMGYSIPAAIGISFAKKRTVYAFCGDGGIQMCLNELNTVIKNGLPIKIFILNDKALSMIIEFQDSYLENRHVATDERYKDGDYKSCDICEIAEAYGINSMDICDEKDLQSSLFFDYLYDSNPVVFNINI